MREIIYLCSESSWNTTATPSLVKETSNSTHVAPFFLASLRAARVFSGASSPAARWATLLRGKLWPWPWLVVDLGCWSAVAVVVAVVVSSSVAYGGEERRKMCCVEPFSSRQS